MIKIISTSVILFSTLLIHASAFSATLNNTFTDYMLEWRQKSQLAEDYLIKAEQSFKLDSRYDACQNQLLASKYGVEAFQALINAQLINNTEQDLEDVESKLNKWRRLSNCSPITTLFKNKVS